MAAPPAAAPAFQHGLEREDRVARLRTYSRYVNLVLTVLLLVTILQSVRESAPTASPFHLDITTVLLPLFYFLVIFNVVIVAVDGLELYWTADIRTRVWRSEDFLANARPIAVICLILGILFSNAAVTGMIEDLGGSSGTETIEPGQAFPLTFGATDPVEFSFIGPMEVSTASGPLTVIVVKEEDYPDLEGSGFNVTAPDVAADIVWNKTGVYRTTVKLPPGKVENVPMVLVIYNPGNDSVTASYRIRHELSGRLFGNLVFFSFLFFAYNTAWALTLFILRKRYVAEFIAREQLRLMRNYAIEEVFLIYKDGRLIVHNSRRLKPDLDKDVLTGMLTAVQNFVKDSFSEESGHLNELKYGNLKILMENGPRANLAVVISGAEPPGLRANMRTLLSGIHDKYMKILDDWDGDTGTLRVLKRHIGLLLPEDRQRARGVIEEVLLFYRDNRFMMHVSQRGQPDVDDSLLAQLLEEIRRKVGESTSTLQSAGISEMPYGNWKVLLEYGVNCYMAVLVSGPEPPDMRGRIRQLLDDISTGFENVLQGWDGSTQRLSDMKIMLESLFTESLEKGKMKK